MTNETSIGKIGAALAKAQGKIKGAAKDSTNPHFKSKYAGLSSIWDACREQLSENEIAVVQSPELLEGKMVLRTTLIHSSGEHIEGYLPISVAPNSTAQQVGSAITYARRYSLASMVGVAPSEDDDDGNAASETKSQSVPAGSYGAKRKPPEPKAPKVEAPHDPATGELLQPHSIPVPLNDEGSDWGTWAETMAAVVKGSKFPDELNAWVMANAIPMGGLAKECEGKTPSLHRKLIKTIELKRVSFFGKDEATTGAVLGDSIPEFGFAG